MMLYPAGLLDMALQFSAASYMQYSQYSKKCSATLWIESFEGMSHWEMSQEKTQGSEYFPSHMVTVAIDLTHLRSSEMGSEASRKAQS